MLKIAAIIPCLNEKLGIEQTVAQIGQVIPEAVIYVCDNGSSDGTPEIARKAGAIVEVCNQKGKGNALHHMFTGIDADYYFIVDGDNTYDVKEVGRLIEKAQKQHLDMIIGTRNVIKRPLHSAGNRFFNLLFNLCFSAQFSDIFSGYRILSRRFVKSFPMKAKGFEIESEMCIHCRLIQANWYETNIKYTDRVHGSKLSTFKDGFKILLFIIKSLAIFMPIRLCSGLALLGGSIGFYQESLFLIIIGLVLNIISQGLIEQRKLIYNSYS